MAQVSDPGAMTRLAIFRPAATQEPQVPAESTPWWRRLNILGGSRQSVLEIQHAVLERLLALLEAARENVSAGWVQEGWWATPAGSGQRILMTGLAAGASIPGNADAVCLVGALIRAGRAQGADSEFGRAIDAVYDAVWESRGEPLTATGMLTVPAPHVRQARTQALTRWNDTQGRTSGEVLEVLDRAIARVIQTLAALPAPHAPEMARA